MKRGFVAVFAIGALLTANAAFAADAAVAQLSGVKGSVMVNSGGKVAPATQGSLKVGDRVVAGNDAKAQVRFADGCIVSLKPASMLTVSAKSPCASGAGMVSVDQAQPMELLSDGGGSAVLTFLIGAVVIGAIVEGSSNSP